MDKCKYSQKLLDWAKENQIDSNDIQNIKSLDFSYKKLNIFPPFILEFTSLESLNLSHNHLKELPINLTILKSLKKLDISWNHIMDISFLSKNIEINSAWNRL